MRKVFLLFALSLLAIGCSNDLNDVQQAESSVHKSTNVYLILTDRATDKQYFVGVDGNQGYREMRKKGEKLDDGVKFEGGVYYIIPIWHYRDLESEWKHLKQVGLKDIHYYKSYVWYSHILIPEKYYDIPSIN